MAVHTDWKAYSKFCNKITINANLANKTHIDIEIKSPIQHIQKAYRKATRTVSTYNARLITDPFFQDTIKNRNKMRREYQRTGNPIFKLQRNILTNVIKKK